MKKTALSFIASLCLAVGLTAAEPPARPELTVDQKLAVAQKQLTEQQAEIALLQAQVAAAQKESQAIIGRVNYQTAIEKLRVASKVDQGCEVGITQEWICPQPSTLPDTPVKPVEKGEKK